MIFKTWLPVLAFMAGVSAATPASAQWYVGGDAGVSLFGGSHETVSAAGIRGSKTSYNPIGFSGLMQFGYDFGGPRLEVEGGYRYASFKSVETQRGGTLHARGEMQLGSFMVNGLYYLFPSSDWHPFIGAGVGAAYRSSELKGSFFNRPWSLKGEGWSLAYQGMAGLAYDATKSLTLKIQYRYFSTADKLKMKLSFAPSIPLKADSHSDNAILMGASYKFQ